jgi:hypothetical protein
VLSRGSVESGDVFVMPEPTEAIGLWLATAIHEPRSTSIRFSIIVWKRSARVRASTNTAARLGSGRVPRRRPLSGTDVAADNGLIAVPSQ